MDTLVTIKGVSDGFLLVIDESINDSEVENKVIEKLKKIGHILKDANIYVDSVRKESLSILLEPILKKIFFVNTVVPFQIKASVNNSSAKTTTQQTKNTESSNENISPWAAMESSSLIISGRVRSGQKINAKKHLIIMGDVNPGAEIIAGGDIIVIGTLSGTAIAGQNRDDTAIIFAMNFKPTQIQINDIIGLGGDKKNSPAPEIAFLSDSRELVIKNYMEENPFAKLPWPKAR